MIDKTKELVEEKFTIANGYAHDAKVLILIIFCRNIFEIENNIHGRVEIWNLTRISREDISPLTRISHEDILRRYLTTHEESHEDISRG